MPGAESFQTLERLLSRLALDVFLLGTAIFGAPPYSITIYFSKSSFSFAIRGSIFFEAQEHEP